jgi:Tol biopolymer transport system component
MRRILLCLPFLLLACPLGAQVPPDADWQALETTHFRITFGPGLTTLAQRAAVTAEAAYERVARLVTAPPAGKIDLLLTDHVDITNGFAQLFPSNRITVFARPPVDDPALADYDDWLDLVITHELTHTFHLDRAGRFGRAVRAVFGRVPLTWPLFPALGTPRWNIEGLAVVAETELTGGGRNHGTYHDMVVRTAVLADRFDRMDRLNASSPIWPGDQRVYIYGSLFMEYLAATYGLDVHRELVEKTASAVLPPLLFFDRVAQRTFDASFDEAYADWRAQLGARVNALADSLRAAVLTDAERVTEHGWYALHPRVSPDGGALAYAALDGRETTATRVVALPDGARQWQRRRNGTGALAWLPDGSGVVVSQLEHVSPYHVYQDLYVERADGTRRITRGARLQDPDVAGDGERIVAVENGDGTNRLVIVRRSSGAVRAVTAAELDVNWAFPRWSPDGTRIAAARWTRGGDYDVVVLDTTGTVLSRITADRAIDTHPTWSADGRWIVFSSDRSGIANLYAARVAGLLSVDAAVVTAAASGPPVVDGSRIRRITNVLTGAFHPDVSADGRWLFHAAYDADGYHVARMPFDSMAWRDPAPLRVTDPPSPVAAGRANGADGGAAGEPRDYSVWPTIAPTSWGPIVYIDPDVGDFIGASTGGTDLVGRFSWGAGLAIDPSSRRFLGNAVVAYAGLGNPLLTVHAARSWDDIGAVLVADDTLAVVEREDEIGIGATLLRRRWRSTGSLSLGLSRVGQRRTIEDAPPGVALRDASAGLLELTGRVGYANYRAQPFSISREDGVSVSFQAEHLLDQDPDSAFDATTTELTAFGAAYKALHPWGFANHVIAARASALVRLQDGAVPTRIGGVSGSVVNVLGLGLGEGSLLLPVRGFDRDRRGTRAWTASAEYRVPIALVGRRHRFSPIYIDRISALAFTDAGDAWCAGEALASFPISCGVRDDGTVADPPPLISAGAELVLDIGFTRLIPALVRAGFAVPIQGPGDGLRFHIQLGASF